MKNILIISPEAWSDHFVSKHHYAINLAELGKKVYFFDPPSTSTTDIEISPVDKIRNLFIIRSPQVARGLRFYPAIFRRWREKRWLAQLEYRAGCTIDTIWLFENSRFYDMDFAGSRLKIYHQVDLNQDFHPTTAARTADVCFCTSDGILARLLPYNQRVYKIHHGTSLPTQPLALSTEQTAYFTHDMANAVYIGNLDSHYLNAGLLAQAVQSHPAVRFHFVGGYSHQGELYKYTKKLPNIVWWGKVSSQLIPTILSRADVVLCTYKSEQYPEQLASPHKFMEYFACGKTIVATYTDEYKNKRHLLEMVDHSSDYSSILQRVLNNLSTYNSLERQTERIKFAMTHTYSRQVRAIFSILEQHGLATPLDYKNTK